MLGSWLPAAIYWLGASMAAAFGGRAPEPADVFRSWGLDALADDASEAETDLVFSAFGLGLDGDGNKLHGVVGFTPDDKADGVQGANREERNDGSIHVFHSNTGCENHEKEEIGDRHHKMCNGTQRPRPIGDESGTEHAMEPSGFLEKHNPIVERA